MEENQEFFAYCEGRRMMVRVVDPHCPLCGAIPRIDEPVIYSRVGGDSGNGYEPFHKSCLDFRSAQAEQAVAKEELQALRSAFTADWPNESWSALGSIIHEYSLVSGENSFAATVNILVRDIAEAISGEGDHDIEVFRMYFQKYIAAH